MTAPGHCRALIADDEPLLRERLAAWLARLWPQLEVVAMARHGREALEAFERERPDVAFLDVHMPGVDGVAVARAIAGRALVVFVTAHDRYAVAAFEEGAVDYLLKPFDEERLATCLRRIQQRLGSRGPDAAASRSPAPLGLSETQLDQLAAALLGRTRVSTGAAAPRSTADLPSAEAPVSVRLDASLPLRWIRASVGSAIKLIPVDEVIYLKSDEKYTLVAWTGGEALIRKTIRELTEELDPSLFVQVHRSAIVNLRHVAQVVRGPNETADVHLRGRSEVLPVSRSCLHLFRQM